jgi:hypothetical protein
MSDIHIAVWHSADMDLCVQKAETL